MEEFDEKQFIKAYHDDEQKRQAWLEEIVWVRMRIILEGFNFEEDLFVIDPTLKIERISESDLALFSSRLNNVSFYSNENRFVATYDFQLSHGDIRSAKPGEAIKKLSIFFTLAGLYSLNTNKAHFLHTVKGELVSGGFWSMPELLLFPEKITYENNQLDKLKMIWPKFEKEYMQNSQFAVIARRYFYSKVRLDWQDKIIDLMISLEALLVPETDGSKSDKIASRLPKLLSESNPSEMASTMTAAYRLRNDVVHGSAIELEETHDQLLEKVIHYTQKAIQAYLEQYPGLSSAQLIKKLDPAPAK